jgi:hypothetical protein
MAAAAAGISEAAAGRISVGAAERISVAAARTLAVEGRISEAAALASAVEGRISEAAALASAEAGCTLAAHISAARALVAGPRYRTWHRGQVFAGNARIRFAAVRTGRPAAQRG